MAARSSPTPARTADVAGAADRVGAFIRDELGGVARAVSIDSAKAIQRRVEAVRALEG